MLRLDGLISVNYSFSKVNYYDTHVVAPFALSYIYVGGQEGVHETFTNFGQLHFALHLNVNIVNNLLTRFGFPNSIAPDNDKVSFVC